MTTEEAPPADVLVVGGGPVGLTLACELFRHGVPCRVIDMGEGPSVWSKAAAVFPRALEIFDDMGIAAEAVARGRRLYGANLFAGERRVAHIALDVPGSPYPYVLGLSQREAEILLGEHLERLGGRVERGVKLEALRQDEGSVTATLSRADGSREEARAGWLVGCDGAHSTARKEIGLAFEGSTSQQTLLQADVRAKLPVPLEEGEAAVFVSPAGAAGFLPLLDEERYRLILMAPPEGRTEATLENVRSIVEERCPPGTEVSEPAWIVAFQFHSRIAPKYQVGRVFLAGDAAHIHSPAGAQGMNLGIQDAYNLAWKLALVARGAARPSLLGSYHAERHPIADIVVRTTDVGTRGMLRMLALRAPLARELRNQAISFLVGLSMFQERALRSLGGMTVDYRKSPAVGEHRSSIWRSNVLIDRSAEAPGLRDWLDFQSAPGPGARAGDVDLAQPLDGKQTLFDLTRGTRHTLLLFDGAAATEEGYRTLARIAARARERYGAWIETYVVTPCAEVPSGLLWDGPVVLDEGGPLHQHFGASSECLYLIRPDGYVGFRSQPADEVKLFEYLDTIFV